MTIKNETTHGGNRSGSGRKPEEDKKVTVPIYPRQSRVTLLGIDNTKKVALEAVEKEFERLIKLSKKINKDLLKKT